jgi:hypothetical protein
MKKPIAYSVLKQLAIFVFLVGVVLLIDHLAGQIREGYASPWSLIGGAASIVTGLLFAVLGDLGIRLHRIEQEAGKAPQHPAANRQGEHGVIAPGDRVSKD